MTSGKLASQAGHAYLAAYLQSPDKAYLASPTKICLGADARTFDRVARTLSQQCAATSVEIHDPDFTIREGRVVPASPSDLPAFTAIGLGPVERAQTPACVRKLKLME